ncbi:MAG: MFS transporter [Candidatus Binatia bacterium]
MTPTERTYYLLTCVYRTAWSALGPVYGLFLLDRGLDLLQLNLVLAVYLITTCVLEVPTGAIADVCGRKASFLLSCVVRAAAFGLYYFSNSFLEFVVAEVIDAVGTTLATGAFDAWAVDGVRRDGDERPVDRLFARGQMLGQAMALLGGLLAAKLAERDLALPWLVGCAGFLLCAALGLVLMREAPRAREAAGGRSRSFTAAVVEGLEIVGSAPILRQLCLVTALSAGAAMPAFQMWQPRLSGLAGQGPWLMGWVWALLGLASLVGSAAVPWLLPRLGRARTLALATAWQAVTLACAGAAAGFPLAVSGFLLQQIGFGITEPVLQAWMNEHATAARRATVLSIRSMAFTLGGGSGLIALGWLAQRSDIGVAWMASALIYAAAAPLFLLLRRVDHRRAPQAV